MLKSFLHYLLNRGIAGFCRRGCAIPDLDDLITLSSDVESRVNSASDSDEDHLTIANMLMQRQPKNLRLVWKPKQESNGGDAISQGPLVVPQDRSLTPHVPITRGKEKEEAKKKDKEKRDREKQEKRPSDGTPSRLEKCPKQFGIGEAEPPSTADPAGPSSSIP